MFNAVTGEWDPPPAATTGPSWITARATFNATQLETQGVQARVMERLKAAGFPNASVTVSSNEGLLTGTRVGQTATVRVLQVGATQRTVEQATAAAFAPEKLAGFGVAWSELRDEVAVPTVRETVELAGDAAAGAAGFAWKALPWWVWPLAGVVVLALLLPYVGPLLLARRARP